MGGLAPVQQPFCYHCGCEVPPGECAKKLCPSLAVGDCASCGCTVTGNCPVKVCTTWAFSCAAAGTLKDCKDCGCECCYHIDETCQITAGFTCGGVVIEDDGQVTHTVGTIQVCSFWKHDDPLAFFYTTSPAGPAELRIYGGNPCCP